MGLSMTRNWWAIALRGVVAILFGLAAFLLPGLTVAALVLLYGAYVLVDGIFAIVAAIRSGERGEHWGALLFEGILGIAAGIIAFVWPGITAIALVYLIGAWAVITGVLEIAAALRLRRVMAGEWMLGLTGVASILLGVLLFAAPGAGLVAWAWMIGAYAVVFGCLNLALAMRLRRFGLETGARMGGGQEEYRRAA